MRSSWKGLVNKNRIFYDSKDFVFSRNGNYINSLFCLNYFKYLALCRFDTSGLFKFSVSVQKFKVLASCFLSFDYGLVGQRVWGKGSFIFCFEGTYRIEMYNGRRLVSYLISEVKHGSRFGEFLVTKGKEQVKLKGKKKRSLNKLKLFSKLKSSTKLKRLNKLNY